MDQGRRRVPSGYGYGLSRRNYKRSGLQRGRVTERKGIHWWQVRGIGLATLARPVNPAHSTTHRHLQLFEALQAVRVNCCDHDGIESRVDKERYMPAFQAVRVRLVSLHSSANGNLDVLLLDLTHGRPILRHLHFPSGSHLLPLPLAPLLPPVDSPHATTDRHLQLGRL